jgi:hypothetical protein
MARKELLLALSCFNELISARRIDTRLFFGRFALQALKLKIADDKKRHEASFSGHDVRAKTVLLSRRAQIISLLSLARFLPNELLSAEEAQ